MVSLGANVLSGLEHSAFGAIIGALAVAGYLFAEVYGHVRTPLKGSSRRRSAPGTACRRRVAGALAPAAA